MSRDVVVHGIIRDQRIELLEPIQLPDGQHVTVRVEPSTMTETGEGLLKSAGGWSDDAEALDDFLEWNRRERKGGRPELEG